MTAGDGRWRQRWEARSTALSTNGTYDSWGNLTEKNIYPYTAAEDPGTSVQTIPYGYTNSAWKDQLTCYSNQSIAYDSMGNPITYLGKTLSWEGKRLKTVGTTRYDYN